MPRKKITNRTKKRAKLFLKRAVKRGEVEAPEKEKPPPKQRRVYHEPVHRLELRSTFLKLSPEFLDESKMIAATIPLDRPLPPDAAALAPPDTGNQDPNSLSCMTRPEWDFGMSKEEVEGNEEAAFTGWLTQTDQAIEAWQADLDAKRKADLGEFEAPKTMPASPTYFERNIEVWRQLWRTTELSQILLILVDSRCPSLHFPPSLVSYLTKLNKKFILVLTKVDIPGPEKVAAWKAYLHDRHPTIPIVEVESYTEKTRTDVHQGMRKFEPNIPDKFKAALIDAIKKAHSELLEPPENIRSNPDVLKDWLPPVRKEVDWEGLLSAKGDKVGAPIPFHPADCEDASASASASHGRNARDFLTVGLIGQPNVGKSSLLNALFGRPKVTVSKTPGKTKHFQTLFWTPDVRLVDCPGIVFPNFVPLEIQVLSGIIPISRVSAVPACVHFAGQRLPLEQIYQLRHPSTDEPLKEDKRTWRAGMTPRLKVSPSQRPVSWTAMDILTVYATVKGYVTAQAGRPDIHRAGNAILRALSEGRISWAFWPPSKEPTDSNETGIWIPGNDDVESDHEHEETIRPESDSEEEEEGSLDRSEEDDSDSEESEDEEDNNLDDIEGQTGGLGRFGALAVTQEEDASSVPPSPA